MAGEYPVIFWYRKKYFIEQKDFRAGCTQIGLETHCAFEKIVIIEINKKLKMNKLY